MANTLTNLAADIYKAADTVGRELVGFIPSSTINADTARVALNDTVRSHFTRTASATSISESMTIPQGTDQTVDTKTMTIDNARAVQIPWTGEDMKHVNNGSGFETIYGDQIAQAMRTLTNEIEEDLWQAAYQGASRAVGTAGTTPFASNFDLIADARQIIADNGGVTNDGRLSLVLNTAAGTKLRNLAQLQKANESGGSQLLRQGTLLDLQGCMLKESGKIAVHTAVGSDDHVVNGAVALNGTTITVDGVQTTDGTAGDILQFSGDTTRNYILHTHAASATMTIGTPGAQVAIADNETIAVGASYTPNVLFHQSAVELAIRAPATPDGDAASDMMMVQDPHSGLIFEIRVYKGYRKQMVEVAAAWGVKAWKPDNIALIMG